MRIVAVERTGDTVRVARAERLLGALRITGVESRPADAPFAVPRGATVRTAIPVAAVAHRVLMMPFRDRRRLAATVPLELLGQLPAEPEAPRVAFVPLRTHAAGTLVLAAVARTADVDALAASMPLTPAQIDVAPLPIWNLVPGRLGDVVIVLADGGDSAVSVRRGGVVRTLRALGGRPDDPEAFVTEVGWSLAAFGGAPPLLVVTGADADGDLRARLAAATRARTMSLAEVAAAALPREADAYAVVLGLVAGAAGGGTGLDLGAGLAPAPLWSRRARRLAAAVAALALLDVGLARVQLTWRLRALDRAIAAEAASAFPETPPAHPRAALAEAVERAGLDAVPGERVAALEVIREVVERLPAGALRVESLVVERDAVRIAGRAESFETLDAIRRGLAGSPLLTDVTVEETHAPVDGSGVAVRLRGGRRPWGGTRS